MFLEHNFNSTLSFTFNFYENEYPLYKYLLIPQAWTVGLELTFYIVVPFLNKKSSGFLISLITISLLFRIYSYEILSLNSDPWNYRFFPFEIAFFILGMLSNRFYKVIENHATFQALYEKVSNTSLFIQYTFLAITFYFLKLTNILFSKFISQTYPEILCYFIWFLILPVLFMVFVTNKKDRLIGELSYPIYLIHLILIIYIKEIFLQFNINMFYIGILASAVSISSAIIIYLYFIKPIDQKRYALTKLNLNKDKS